MESKRNTRTGLESMCVITQRVVNKVGESEAQKAKQECMRVAMMKMRFRNGEHRAITIQYNVNRSDGEGKKTEV